ncbi:MAG: FtsW/RodA/SpoVE family cell cycle protein, partial [Polyangiaceae bacterium]|nr:FtsW/RodA/SpoVE family cell cycle protein [Polyangiaceae bacterium]
MKKKGSFQHRAEIAALLGAIPLAWFLGAIASDAWFARVAELGAALPARELVVSLGRRANVLFSAGVLLLTAVRSMSVARARDPLAVPLLLPGTVFACLLGLVVHHASVELVHRTVDGARVATVLVPSASSYAEGFALGALLAGVLIALPFDLAALSSRLRIPIAATIAAIFVGLAVAGTGPGSSGTKINLGPVQPIEAVKPLFVMFLAAYLGARASKLRWQRRRFLGLRWPRLTLLLPAVLVLVAIFAGLYVVGDLGPVLILALVFLGMFYLVTRATGWVVVSIAIVCAGLAIVATKPEVVGLGRVATRAAMWLDPWWNGVAYGDQLGESLWAIAAGGSWGQGLAGGRAPLVAAGKTDLILATLAEQLGAAGLLGYVALFAAV